MNRILVNVESSEWSVHFIGPDGKTRIGPWLLHDSRDEVRKLQARENPTPKDLQEHEDSMRQWEFQVSLGT